MQGGESLKARKAKFAKAYLALTREHIARGADTPENRADFKRDFDSLVEKYRVYTLTARYTA